MNPRRILSQAALVIGALVFSIGLQAYAATWAAPTQGPTGGNAEAPLDTGANPNTKQGGLVLGAGGVTNALFVASGAIQFATNSLGTCSGTQAGSIRYDGTDLMGCVGGSWKSLTAGVVVSHGTQLYDTAGTYSFNVEAGVPYTVQLWGGGGGGGGGSNQGQRSSGGGGGGGAWGQFTYTSPTSKTISVVVGVGGTGGPSSNCVIRGGNAGGTQFDTYVAGGGWGGGWNVTTCDSEVSLGGYGGGTSIAGGQSGGGGGDGNIGDGTPGGNGGNAGGSGGTGGTSDGYGQAKPGNPPGGGGAGGWNGSGSPGTFGAPGAPGKAYIVW